MKMGDMGRMRATWYYEWSRNYTALARTGESFAERDTVQHLLIADNIMCYEVHRTYYKPWRNTAWLHIMQQQNPQHNPCRAWFAYCRKPQQLEANQTPNQLTCEKNSLPL
eukprot:GHUV01041470.1.p1 GENE.GHUV01041470.1~~GHUV01041470.1.p1  ORF type:complete len:110 (+),score=13.98 GHUV01041470.1:87-416(+)